MSAREADFPEFKELLLLDTLALLLGIIATLEGSCNQITRSIDCFLTDIIRTLLQQHTRFPLFPRHFPLLSITTIASVLATEATCILSWCLVVLILAIRTLVVLVDRSGLPIEQAFVFLY